MKQVIKFFRNDEGLVNIISCEEIGRLPLSYSQHLLLHAFEV